MHVSIPNGTCLLHHHVYKKLHQPDTLYSCFFPFTKQSFLSQPEWNEPSISFHVLHIKSQRYIFSIEWFPMNSPQTLLPFIAQWMKLSLSLLHYISIYSVFDKEKSSWLRCLFTESESYFPSSPIHSTPSASSYLRKWNPFSWLVLICEKNEMKNESLEEWFPLLIKLK